MSLRVIFMGTPDFATATLAEIIGQGHEVVAAYTRAPAQRGRGMALTPSPVERMARGFGIPVFTPKSLKSAEVQTTFKEHNADVAVVVAYGLLLPQAILDIPREGCINLHGSVLPRWRGAAPIHRAVMAGDVETGVAVMRMDANLDTGSVGMIERIAIHPQTTTGELHDRLSVLGADLMARALAAISRGSLQFVPQSNIGVTYAEKITNEEAQIDWAQSAHVINNHIRGLNPFPCAYSMMDFGKGLERVKILKAQLFEQNAETTDAHKPIGLVDENGIVTCGQGSIQLIEVQRAGKTAMIFAEFWRGVGSPSHMSFMCITG